MSSIRGIPFRTYSTTPPPAYARRASSSEQIVLPTRIETVEERIQARQAWYEAQIGKVYRLCKKAVLWLRGLL